MKLLWSLTHSDSHGSLSCYTEPSVKYLIICAQKPGGKKRTRYQREPVPTHKHELPFWGICVAAAPLPTAWLCSVPPSRQVTTPEQPPRSNRHLRVDRRKPNLSPLTPITILQPSRQSSYSCCFSSEIWFTTKFPEQNSHIQKGKTTPLELIPFPLPPASLGECGRGSKRWGFRGQDNCLPQPRTPCFLQLRS